MSIKDRFRIKFENYSLNNEIFNFEIREEQLEFLKIWEKALNNERIALIDAPTGIGKTFAYLYPIIERIVNGKDFKAIVATSTINLQEQIFEKDIPLLREIFDENFSVKVLKGRKNYLCKRKAHDFINHSKENDLVKKLINWMDKTFTGEYQEIENKFPLYHWHQLESQASTCLNKACRYHGNCYFFNSRIEAENSDILIINHHLLITDIAQKEYPFIEKSNAVVIDEAHNFVPTIESILTKVISLSEVINKSDELEKLLNDAYFRNFFKNEPDDYLESVDRLLKKGKVFKSETGRFFDFLKELFKKEGQYNLNKIDDGRILKGVYFSIDEYLDEVENLNSGLAVLGLKLKDYGDSVSEKRLAFFKPYEIKFTSISDFFSELRVILYDGFLDKKDDLTVAKWVDVRENNIVFNSLDLNDSDNLSKEIIPVQKPVLLTSATLSLNGRFNNVKIPLGISDEETEEYFLSSPFDLKNQMTIWVFDLNYSFQSKEYYEELNNILLKILKKGHALVLFASYYDMNAVYKKFRSKFSKKYPEISLYIQGREFSRSELIELFKSEKNTVLFGTRSFWEGIDIKGSKLTTVVITKLPFKSINDPVFFSKDKLLKMQGKNSFTELMLPDMILTLKQGIGRLIRSKEDIGRVYILDKRFKDSSYSGIIMNEFKDYTIKSYKEKERLF